MPKNSGQLQTSKQKNSQGLISSHLDSLAKILAKQEDEQVFKVNEVDYFTRQCESLGIKDLSILSLKMSKVYSQVTREKTLRSYCKRLPTLGMMVNGNYLIQGGFSPKIESGYILSDILEEEVDPKYFLSKKMEERIAVADEKINPK